MSDQTMRRAVDKANSHLAIYSEDVSQGRWRLLYHFMPPVGWMNDPNGFVEFRGLYHLFYQFSPYDIEPTNIHWGHTVSADLVHWKHLPIALAPSETYDQGEDGTHFGCFSGSAFVTDDEELALMYTGHVFDRHINQTQNIAVSSDGIRFTKLDCNPVIGRVPAGNGRDFRDPKVFEVGGRRFVAIGGSRNQTARVLVYRNDGDLAEWSYVGVAAEDYRESATMWECPDIFSLDGSDVMLVSPMNGTENTNPIAFIGHFDPTSGRFEARSEQVIDSGVDFYAAQTMVDSSNRRVMIAWMQQWHQRNVTAGEGWAGAMTIPRELRVIDGKLVQQPIEELRLLRGEPTRINPQVVSERTLIADTGVSAEATIRLRRMSSDRARVLLRADEDGDQETAVVVDFAAGLISCDRQLSGVGDVSSSSADLGGAFSEVELCCLLDTCSLEIFINGGAATLTNRIYPEATSTGLFVEAIDGGTVAVVDGTTWPLGRAL